MNDEKRPNPSAPKKGERGYLNAQHTSSLIRFLIPGVITVVLTLCTWVIFPQYGKVFLVLSVISAIPTAMAAVNLIMFLRFKSIDEEVYKRIEEVRGNTLVFYDSVITTTDKSYFVPAVAVQNKNTMLLTSPDIKDENELLRHLNLMAKKNGFREWNIKIYKDTEEFVKRISLFNEQNLKVLKKDEEMLNLISNLSL